MKRAHRSSANNATGDSSGNNNVQQTIPIPKDETPSVKAADQ
jgi:hypothetical protein